MVITPPQLHHFRLQGQGLILSGRSVRAGRGCWVRILEPRLARRFGMCRFSSLLLHPEGASLAWGSGQSSRSWHSQPLHPATPGHDRLLPFRDKYFSESRSLKEGTDIVPSLSEHKRRKRVPLWGCGHPSLLAPWWLGPSLLPHPACSHSCSFVSGFQRSAHIHGASLCSSGWLLFPVGGVTFPDSGMFPILRDFSECVQSSSGSPQRVLPTPGEVHLDWLQVRRLRAPPACSLCWGADGHGHMAGMLAHSEVATHVAVLPSRLAPPLMTSPSSYVQAG